MCSLATFHIRVYSIMWMTPIFFHIIYFYTRHVKWRLSRTLHVAFQEFKSFTIYFSFFRGHNGVRSAIASLGCDVRYIDNNVIVIVDQEEPTDYSWSAALCKVMVWFFQNLSSFLRCPCFVSYYVWYAALKGPGL